MPTEESGVDWFGIVTAESVFGVVVPAEPEPDPASLGGVAPVSVGGVVPPSSGTVGVLSCGTVGVVSVPRGLEGLTAGAAAAAWFAVAVVDALDAEPLDVDVVLARCPWGETWWPRSLTLGAGLRAAVVTAAGGEEAESGWGLSFPDLTSRTTASVTTAPVTKQRRLRRITTFFTTIVTRRR